MIDTEYLQKQISKNEEKIDRLLSEYTQLVILFNDLKTNLKIAITTLEEHKKLLQVNIKEVREEIRAMSPGTLTPLSSEDSPKKEVWIAIISAVSAVIITLCTGLIDSLSKLLDLIPKLFGK